jgi:hypothetical protein
MSYDWLGSTTRNACFLHDTGGSRSSGDASLGQHVSNDYEFFALGGLMLLFG